MNDYKSELMRAAYGEDAEIEPYEVLFFCEDAGPYEGSLYSVLRKDGQLFEYEDSHCSCNGFGFNPMPVTPEYVKHRANSEKSYCAGESEWVEFKKIAEAL